MGRLYGNIFKTVRADDVADVGLLRWLVQGIVPAAILCYRTLLRAFGGNPTLDADGSEIALNATGNNIKLTSDCQEEN